MLRHAIQSVKKSKEERTKHKPVHSNSRLLKLRTHQFGQMYRSALGSIVGKMSLSIPHHPTHTRNGNNACREFLKFASTFTRRSLEEREESYRSEVH